jgi:hypothetical protein
MGRLPRVLLCLEGGAVAVAGLAVYVDQGYGWLLLLLLALAPDLSMLGYAAGQRAGALAYDIAHTEALPLVLGVAGLLAGSDRALQLALIWLIHIGADRAIGYGLKYPGAFKDTHLQRV